MKSLKFIALLVLISSCGGGGGGGDSVPFAITLAPNSISVDEDNIFNGSFAARANEPVTLTYSLTSGTSNGQINISASSGSVTYTPDSNFNGEDSFTYSVTASEKVLPKLALLRLQ